MKYPNDFINKIICGDSVRVAPSLFQKGSGGSIPTSPLQLKIEFINVKLACKLNEKWHSRLPKIHWSNIVRNTHYVCFGAEYDYKWYAVGIWSSPVAQNRFKDGKKMLELRRLAICNDAPLNTASRMIKIMIIKIKDKFPEIDRLISYQDTEVHNGTIYKASNWNIINKSKGMSWTTKTRKRNKEQTLAKKIRWEYFI
jgi:hypothetical protein